jgi:oligo-1,6-glucosidase
MFDYKHAVIYQIWPRSFQDSDRNGIGDLSGIRSRLDYLSDLGIDAIWLSPVYASPNTDYGYDISDYYAVNPEYGTMEDLKLLIREAKERHIAILMDLVANHTSTRHPWFQEALKNPDSPYRDWYIFRKGTVSSPPNNWLSFFGVSAWQKAEDDMWYLTLYTEQQADLNWRCPDVRKEIAKIVNFYLDLGVEGFRLDTINTIDKDPNFPSQNPEKKGLQFPGNLVLDRPMVKQWLKELEEESWGRRDAFALGEGVMTTEASVKEYCGNGKPLQMMFQFDTVCLGYGELGKYDPRKLYLITNQQFKQVTRKWMTAQQRDHTWLGNYLSNHDHKRHLDRFGNDGKYRVRSAEMLALYNFTLYGTPFIYQGEEIAMTNPKLKKQDWRDYEAFHSSKAMTEILHIPPFLAEKITSFVDRDNARTPMQWSDQKNAGFTEGVPWIQVNPDYPAWNVKSEQADPDSVLNFYQALIRLHHEHEALCTGSWRELIPDHPHVLAYVRENEEERLTVILNLSRHAQKAVLPENEIVPSEDLLTSTVPRALTAEMKLLPYEAHLFLHRKHHS